MVTPAVGERLPSGHASEVPQRMSSESIDLVRTRTWVERGVDRGSHDTCQIAVRWPGGSFTTTWGSGAAGPGGVEGSRPLTCLSKPLAAVALAVAGVPFTDPVHRHLPAFTGDGRDAVRLEHLLTHTAMLVDDPLPVGINGISARERVLALRPTVEPGSAAEYSYFANWGLLAAVIEAVVGRTAEAFVTDEVLTPLGLTAIDLCPTVGADVTLELAGGGFGGETDESPVGTFDGRLPDAAPWLGLVGTGTAGAVADLFAAVAEARRGDRRSPLAPDAAREMTSPHRSGVRDDRRGDDLTWGLGFAVDPRPFGHRLSPTVFSHTGALASSVGLADPENGLAACVIFDRTIAGAGSMLRFAGTISALVSDLTDHGALVRS